MQRTSQPVSGFFSVGAEVDVRGVVQIDRPVFILGLSRSGTTLLADILNNHSAFCIYYESFFLTRVRRVFSGRRIESVREFDDMFRRLNLGGHLFWPYYYLDRDSLRRAFWRTGRTGKDLFSLLLATLGSRSGKPRVGEKTAMPLRYLSTILDWYPDAKIVCVYRDPRSAHASWLRCRYTPMAPFFVRTIVERAYFWNRSMRLALQPLRYRGKKIPVCALAFEELLAEPRSVLERVCAFLEVPFEEGMLRVSNRNSSFATARGQPGIDRSVAERSGLLSREQEIIIELLCGKFMVQCGYPVKRFSPRAVRVLDRAGWYAGWYGAYTLYLAIRSALRAVIVGLFCGARKRIWSLREWHTRPCSSVG